ncbi:MULTISPECIES: DUF1643 domain-containing protein [unclassified Arthrobacter]|uniref:DUF1643 domain-containing protein n=1 Tax=Arthrobacter sp. AET 35A TaxID=2292643 RepID=UPI001491C9CB|nr:DUF1643 domain-containing protein [Arthrobacter sp. AET 35A]NOJ63562.1 DUF1643 domain-containing protein [Arthrobacter sp. 147(2020)]
MDKSPHQSPSTGSAAIDGDYRYELSRQWSIADPTAVLTVIMLNPSTADGMLDDPTLRRCISLAKSAGADGLRVLNLFALRSTDPEVLVTAADPVGPANDEYLLAAARESTAIVAAWSGHKVARQRSGDVHAMLRANGVTLQCWGTTKLGHPRHPLYVRGSTVLTPWEPPAR